MSQLQTKPGFKLKQMVSGLVSQSLRAGLRHGSTAAVVAGGLVGAAVVAGGLVGAAVVAGVGMLLNAEIIANEAFI